MASSYSNILIQLGLPIVIPSTLTIYAVGQDGELGAKRTLTHPDSTNFAPITYQKNPDFTSNLDNTVLPSPTSQVVKTASDSVLIRNEGLLSDVVVEETWTASAGKKASMFSSEFRKLYEYLINPPAIDTLNQTYIQWAPRDRSLLTYNVLLFRIVVGSGSGAKIFTIHDVRQPDGQPFASPLDASDVSPDAWLVQSVVLSMKMVSEVVA